MENECSVMTVKDISKYFNCSVLTARKYMDQIGSYDINGRRYVKKEDFIEWFESKKITKKKDDYER